MQQSYLMSNYSQQPVSFVRGDGCFLFDKSSRRYLDFGCGISVTNLGHSNKHLNDCVIEQLPLWHTSNIFPNEIVARLAQRICEASFSGKMFFCNSGAEANEGALKLARIYNNKVHNGKKPRVITMEGSFHGRTIATLSATGQDKIQKGFEPVLQEYSYVAYNDIDALKAELEKGDVSAVMLELIQGESGVLAADDDFIKMVRELTKEYQALMSIDEVQTGFGRTGKLFAFQHVGIIPDIVTMAKGIANGIPMGAILATDEVGALFTPGTHASTFGGNLLAAAAANGVLDILLNAGFLDNVDKLGNYTQSVLKQKLEKYGITVRGKALMIGVVFPDDIKNTDVVSEALSRGLVVIGAGKSAIRFYPVLNAPQDIINEAATILEDSVKAVRERR